MKPNQNIFYTVFALAVVFLLLYVNEKRTNRRLNTALRIEKATADFALSFLKAAPYDSVYSKNDTISFYKQQMLVHKIVTSEK